MERAEYRLLVETEADRDHRTVPVDLPVETSVDMMMTITAVRLIPIPDASK
jgi:hypothetical protein